MGRSPLPARPPRPCPAGHDRVKRSDVIGDAYRPQIQALPREEIRALQESRLRDLIRRVFDQPVPFFRRKLESAGIGPDDVKTLDDLVAVPRTTKQELRDSEAESPPLGDYRGAPLERCVRLSTSTGTTGRPTIIPFTRHDLEVEYDAAGRSFWRQGYRPVRSEERRVGKECRSRWSP